MKGKKEEKKCKSFFKKFDHLYSYITFRIDDEIEYKSVIGGVVTILFVIYSLYYIISCLIPFIKREYVSLIYIYKIKDEVPIIDFRESHFNFAFSASFLDEDHEVETPAVGVFEEYFNFTVNLRVWAGETDIVENYIELRNCQESDFFNEIDPILYDVNSIDDMYCPQINDGTHNFTLEGEYTDDYFKYLIIEIKLKNDVKDDIDKMQKLKEEMENKPMQMIIFFMDSAVDYEEVDKPLKTILNTAYTNIEFNFAKIIDIYTSNLVFARDDNIIVDDKHKYVAPMIDKITENFRFYPNRGVPATTPIDPDSEKFNDQEKDILGRIRFMASRKEIQMERKYQKFPEFIAEVASLLEEILVLCLIIVNFFERRSLEHELISQVFKYSGSKTYDLNYMKNIFKSKKVIKSINKNEIVPIPEIVSNNKQNEGENVENKLIEESKETFTKNTIMAEGKKVNKKSSKNAISFSSFGRGNSNDQVNVSIFRNNIIPGQNPPKKLSAQNFGKKTRPQQRNSVSFSKIKFLSGKKTQENEVYLDYENLSTCGLTIYAYCFFFSLASEKKHKVIEKVIKKVSDYLDVYKYIRRMQEIDTMKYCFFDKDKQILFDFASKASIKMDIGEKENVTEVIEADERDALYDKEGIVIVHNSYNKLKNRKNLSNETKKLMKFIDNEVNFFK